MVEPRLRVHHFLPRSRANGPGLRAVVWLQGCSLGCAGCYNPATHGFAGGTLVSVAALVNRVVALAGTIEGITVSGGEPLQQSRALRRLLEEVRRATRLSTLVFTGYSWEEVQRLPDAAALLGTVDVLIAGRYEAAQRLARDLRGSANKTVHFLTSRYTHKDLHGVPPAEVIITQQGEILLSGIDPINVPLRGGAA